MTSYDLNYFPKALSPNTITLDVGATENLGNTNIKSIALCMSVHSITELENKIE